MNTQSTLGAQSQSAIAASIARLAAGWNAGSGEQWAAEFWPSATLVNILGAYVSGAAAIAAVHKKILAGPFKGSSIALNLRDVRFLGSDAAIVETQTSVTNFPGLPPGAVATAPNLLQTLYLFVYENRGGVWKIDAAQNTAVLPSTAALASPTPS